ncbi:MAG: heavy-metal-associated domain-containing protein [Bryobacterales bacterium]|nr:heavy-metal-associated domain-containing protein [Bryobacterales bacterium]
MSQTPTLNALQTKRLVIVLALAIALIAAGMMWWGLAHPTPKSLQLVTPSRTPGGPAEVRATVHIEGMTCEGCAATIKSSLTKLGVDNVSVDLEKKQAIVLFRTDKVSLGDILSKIHEAGYTPKLLE